MTLQFATGGLMSLTVGAWARTDHSSATKEKTATAAIASQGRKRMKVGAMPCKPLDHFSVMTALHVWLQFSSATMACQATWNTICAYDKAPIGSRGAAAGIGHGFATCVCGKSHAATAGGV